MKIHESLNWRRITPEDGVHYFFGYYDRCPWNHDMSLHLVMKVDQCERVPERGEKAEIGVVDRNGVYTALTTTRTWCHQQGCMTLWLKHRPDCFIYNDYDEKSGNLLARIFQIGKGIVGTYERPVYSMSPDGRYAASLNFGRNPRRGYSYADDPLPLENHPDLDKDGIFIIDLHTGAVNLAVAYRRIFEAHQVPYELEARHIWMDHAIFNCDSSRLLWLFRHCSNTATSWPWKTYMFTADVNGGNLSCPLPDFYWREGQISHQIWGRTPHEVLVDAKWGTGGNEYVVFDERTLPLKAQRISKGMGPMAHLVFSPDGEWMLADTYPDSRGFQRLALVKSSTGELRELGQFRHFQPQGACVDVRCDLHPRWSQDGRTITVDSIHNRERGIYLLDLDDPIKF